jgi:hypothetical protein
MFRVRVVVAVALLASLAFVPAAAAHPRAQGYAKGFQSKILSVLPEVAGLDIRVVDADDRLRVSNKSGTELVVFGYDGEPYLRIGPSGVYRNERSPAAYLNRDRFARVSVPLKADPGATPEWRQVSPRPAWQWHDHRIQWMGAGPPAQVRNAPKETHAIFSWLVPGRLGSERFAVSGRLDYVPPSKGGTPAALVAVVVITGVAAVFALALMLVRLRRGDEAVAEPG